MRKKHTNDPIEIAFEEILIAHNIPYECPDSTKGRMPGKRYLDFYLPTFGLSVELKAYSCERLHKQLRGSGKEKEGIVVIIGLNGVNAFGRLLVAVKENLYKWCLKGAQAARNWAPLIFLFFQMSPNPQRNTND